MKTYPINPKVHPLEAIALHRDGKLGAALDGLSSEEYETTVLGFVAWLDAVKGYNPYHEAVVRAKWGEIWNKQEKEHEQE